MYYRIAGLTVKMNAMQRTEASAIPYMIEFTGVPDITIEPDMDELRKKYPDITDITNDYLASGKNFYQQIVNYNGIGLHSSAVVKDNQAYLFSAPSGTGKSTHTCLWRRVFGDHRIKILNDDKPALRCENGVWYAYGTPWSGKTGQNLNLRYPVKGICFLERGVENKIYRLHGIDSLRSILSQSSEIADKNIKEKHLDLVIKLVEQIPIWKMECNMDPEAALVSYKAMSEIEERKK